MIHWHQFHISLNCVSDHCRLIQRFFPRRQSQRARLEDVVVNNTYRGKQLGKL